MRVNLVKLLWPCKHKLSKGLTPLEQRQRIEEEDGIKIRWFEEQEGLVRESGDSQHDT